MAKEICISTTPHETRLAILEDDLLAEIYYERENEYTLAGSIYKGRVTRVLPGMQSSFVDVGLERDAFLYVTDFLEEQEDSEDYVSEGNGRPARPRLDAGEEGAGQASLQASVQASGQVAGQPQGRSAGSERNPERNPERNQDRETRRPAVPQPVEPAREPVRESGRAGRERARELAVAPLREAIPAAEDLEDKGDEQSPEGTRRWRGRRGRRRGVRGGLPQGAPRPLPGEAAPATPLAAFEDESTGEADSASFSEETSFPIVEHGAPGGTAVPAVIHASSSALAPLPAPRSQARQEEEPARDRQRDRDRDRGLRRPREPYAQASTLDRPRGGEPLRTNSGPAAGVAAAPAGAIVLPGESLSKYGSSPADPAITPAPVTATVPRTLRPVNYVAPRPSTLVELSGSWDGGAVLPGETLSRYREPASIPAAVAYPPAEAVEQPAFETAPAPAPLVEELEEIEQIDAKPTADLSDQDATGDLAPEELAHHVELSPEAPELAEAAHEPLAEPAHTPPATIPAFTEPEIVAEAVTPDAEAPVAPPADEMIVESPDTPELHAPALAEAPTDPAEPAEYDPENASASYRVQRNGPSELRLPSPDLAEESDPQPVPEFAPQHPEDFTAPVFYSQTFAEPTGHFADAPAETAPDVAAPQTPEPEEFPALRGTLATLDATPEQEAVLPAHPLQILHEDGTVDLAAAYEQQTEFYPASHPEEAQAAAEPIEGHSFEFDAAPETQTGEPYPPHSSAFSDLVDRMQGFAPGHGLLEEETIDEEEYDFEPMHAHAHAHSDEGDQEDLEEETLDQRMEPSALSDAVRESHIEQRTSETPAAFVAEEEESGFGYEEVEDGEEDFEEAEEGEEAVAQPGVAPDQGRIGRGDESRSRARGRSTGRGMSRNGGRRNGPGRGRSAQSQDLPIISELLKQGQEILVQIAKEPIAKKGARITSHIALPGRFLVFMPTVHHVGVSRKIASDEERQRLKRILTSEKGENSGGFIVRTAAEGASEEDLRADLRFLISLWTEIKQRSDTAKAPALIYHDLNLIERILRDQVSSNFSTIWVDSEAEYERIIRFLARFQPQLVRRVKLYTKETPLFEHFGIQEEISKALKSKVWLKSGGSIVINQTEALVAIDINTGKYVGKTARLEDTIVKTNLDAIPEIVRQIRLRDLGGIIVIDFIDMDERKNRNRVLAALEEELKNDRAPSKVLQFNDFGLVAITRKRVKQSLERTLSVTCETCTGTGMVKSPITVCNEIYIEMRKMLKHLDGKDVMLRVHPEVVKQLKAANGKWINELEELVAKTIIIKSDPALHPEQFDIH
jgi:ribonuclease G